MYALVNDVAHTSESIVSNGVMLGEKLMHKFVERSSCGLILDIVQAYTWWNWGLP